MKTWPTTLTLATCCVVAWVTFLDIQDSNLGPKDSYPDWGFLWFPWSLQANSRRVHQIRPQSLPFISFPNHWSLIILPFDTTQSQLLTASLNHKQTTTNYIYTEYCNYYFFLRLRWDVLLKNCFIWIFYKDLKTGWWSCVQCT
jgi:hypothetical protein